MEPEAELEVEAWMLSELRFLLGFQISMVFSRLLMVL